MNIFKRYFGLLFLVIAPFIIYELVQGAIGFTQYFLDLPVTLVALHMLGAALTAAALAWVVLASRETGVVAAGQAPQV